MNKENLKKELLEKVKKGIKPSDLKRKKNNQINTNQLLTPPPTPPLKPSREDVLSSPIEINQLTNPSVQDRKTGRGVLTPPDSPILKPTKPAKPANNIKDLQEQVRYWSHTAQNYLLNLSKTSAELFNLEEKCKALQKKLNQPNKLNKETEKALIEANQKIRNQQETIKELTQQNTQLSKTTEEHKNTTNSQQETQQTFFCSDCNQTKSTPELSRQFGNHSFCRPCSVKARQQAEKQKPIQFTCAFCKTTQKNPTWIKVAQDDPEYNLIQGQAYSFCSLCAPKIKEFNEADLITDDLWAKYPYSSASEILEKEFGIKGGNKW